MISEKAVVGFPSAIGVRLKLNADNEVTMNNKTLSPDLNIFSQI